MAKSIKLKNNIYIDSSGIVHNRKSLKSYLATRIEFFNDTTATDIKDLIRKKLDFVVNQTADISNGMIFLNGGWKNMNFYCGIGAKLSDKCWQVIIFSHDRACIGRLYNEKYTYKDISLTDIN